MIRSGNVQVWLATAPVDMRRSFDGLAEHVRAFLGHDPLSGQHVRVSQPLVAEGEDSLVGQGRAGDLLQAVGEGNVSVSGGGRIAGKAVAIDSAGLMRLLSGLKPQLVAPARRERASDVQAVRA